MTPSPTEETEEEKVFTCMACDTTFRIDLMIIAHQTFCEGIDPDKREFRKTVLELTVGEHAEEVIELTRQHQAKMAQS